MNPSIKLSCEVSEENFSEWTEKGYGRNLILLMGRGVSMKNIGFLNKQNMSFFSIVIMTISILISGCLGNGGSEQDEDEEKTEFKEYDIFDWSDANENAGYKSTLEIIQILMAHIDDISPGGRITAFGATGATGTGLDRETGKCPAWQFYLLRYEGDQSLSKVINIAEYGWTVVNAEHEVADIYDEWEYSKVTVDSPALITIASTDSTVSSWISNHPNYGLDIQSYHGPPIDSEEESYLLKYKGGADELYVYISGIDGGIIEVEDPNDW
jgi:hypothetical protein